MFKEIVTNRLFIGAFALFILCVMGSLLYMRHVKQTEAVNLAETEERVEQWHERRNQEPPAEVPIVEQSAEAGHFHEDGTFHAEPHETAKPSTEINTPQVSDPPRSEVSNVVPRRLPEDVFSAEYTAQVKAAVQTCVSLFPASDEEREAGGYTESFWILMEALNDAAKLSDLAYRTKNPSYKARSDEIYALQEPFDSITPRPKLSADQLAQVEKAAQEFEVITQRLSPTEQQRLRELGIDNPYRTRLEDEQNR